MDRTAGGVRAPVFLGYRTDKPADEVVRETADLTDGRLGESGTRVTANPALRGGPASTIASRTAQPPVSLLKYA